VAGLEQRRRLIAVLPVVVEEALCPPLGVCLELFDVLLRLSAVFDAELDDYGANRQSVAAGKVLHDSCTHYNVS